MGKLQIYNVFNFFYFLFFIQRIHVFYLAVLSVTWYNEQYWSVDILYAPLIFVNSKYLFLSYMIHCFIITE